LLVRFGVKTVLDIEGMHCKACVGRMTQALQGLPDVQTATVTLNPPRAELESDAPIDLAALQSAASAAGNYRIRPAPAEAAAPAIPVVGDDPTQKKSLYPLWLILSYVAGTSALVTFDDRSWHSYLNTFMAGFFLVFSFFKLLDLRGFAASYRMYDLVAGAIPAWGFIYPFVELGLGIAYSLRWQPMVVNIATLALMLVGALGVLKAMRTKSATRCACLGTALNLPLTAVTLTEDLGMGAMAVAMLLWR
jgi:copper chaperone CopZ